MDNKHLSDLERELLKSLFQPSPLASEELEVRSLSEPGEQGVRYFVYYDVVDELTFASSYHDQPSIAILLGNFSMDEEGPFIEVTGFTALEYMPDRDELFKVLKKGTEEALRGLSQGLTEGGRHVVGFYHGLAGSEGGFDAECARVHLSLFNMPFQVAMILDPDQERFGLYARAVGGRFFNAAFSVVRAHRAGTDTDTDSAPIRGQEEAEQEEVQRTVPD